MKNDKFVPVPPRAEEIELSPQTSILAVLCRRLVIENYTPAALVVVREGESAVSDDLIDKHQRVVPGLLISDLVSVARDHVRKKLRSALLAAGNENDRTRVSGAHKHGSGGETRFRLVVQPIQSEGQELSFVCVFDEGNARLTAAYHSKSQDTSAVRYHKTEFEEMNFELHDPSLSPGMSLEEQGAINEEASSVSEDVQEANEALLTSIKALQARNDDLTARNAQLHEALDRQRTDSSDLQNILSSTGVATLLLDRNFNIRFFTPPTKVLFNLTLSDVGRPLKELHASTTDCTLFNEVETVLNSLKPIERETQTAAGVWFNRRIVPYRAESGETEGVVITFTDITERRRCSEALASAKRQAYRANAAQSRFLEAVSHDLRQPLQTLTLVQGMLTKSVEGHKAMGYLARQDSALRAMSELLTSLFDFYQIEACAMKAEIVEFSLSEMLARLKEEFVSDATSRSAALRVVPSRASVLSDPQFLEQMIRTLVSNARKATKSGKSLVGCRRHKGMLSIEIWHTGIGAPAGDVEAFVEEERQLESDSSASGNGLGLGWSIVKRLGDVLGHPVRVRSRPGKGTVFSIEVQMANYEAAREATSVGLGVAVVAPASAPVVHEVLIVEGDPDLRARLEHLLNEAGHRTVTAADGIGALELIGDRSVKPDILISDYNLPRGMNGVMVAARVREKVARSIPVVILTDDISMDFAQDSSIRTSVRVMKPVKFDELIEVVNALILPRLPSSARPFPDTTVSSLGARRSTENSAKQVRGSDTIFVVDDDPDVREALGAVLRDDGHPVVTFATCEEFLSGYQSGQGALLLVDGYLPGMSGLALLQRLRAEGGRLPAIMITGKSDVHMAVEAMKAGALDFIEKPIGSTELIASVARALEQSKDAHKRVAWQEDAAERLTHLTKQQRRVMELVLSGSPSKNIAADLGISQRTVENHRAQIMKRTGAKSLPALARLAMTAGG